MILDTLDQYRIYQSLDPRIGAGLDWLRNFSPAMSDGRYPIEGETVFALIQSYNTVEPAQKKFEAHRNYLDIQYVAAGYEAIYYAPITSMQVETDYNPESDYALYQEPRDSTMLKLGPNSFAFFFPVDGHKPGCISIRPERVRKVVIKVRL